jgi:hypothetical protein
VLKVKKRVVFRFRTYCLLKVKKSLEILRQTFFSKIKRTQEVHTYKKYLESFFFRMNICCRKEKGNTECFA